MDLGASVNLAALALLLAFELAAELALSSSSGILADGSGILGVDRLRLSSLTCDGAVLVLRVSRVIVVGSVTFDMPCGTKRPSDFSSSLMSGIPGALCFRRVRCESFGRLELSRNSGELPLQSSVIVVPSRIDQRLTLFSLSGASWLANVLTRLFSEKFARKECTSELY